MARNASLLLISGQLTSVVFSVPFPFTNGFGIAMWCCRRLGCRWEDQTSTSTLCWRFTTTTPICIKVRIGLKRILFAKYLHYYNRFAVLYLALKYTHNTNQVAWTALVWPCTTPANYAATTLVSWNWDWNTQTRWPYHPTSLPSPSLVTVFPNVLLWLVVLEVVTCCVLRGIVFMLVYLVPPLCQYFLPVNWMSY